MEALHEFLYQKCKAKELVVIGAFGQQTQFEALLLRKSKGEVTRDDYQRDLLSAELMTWYQESHDGKPILLCIDSDQVLLETHVGEKSSFSEQEFITVEDGETHIQAVIRRDVIKNLLSALPELSAHIIGVRIGPASAIQYIEPEYFTPHILLGNHQVEKQEDEFIFTPASKQEVEWKEERYSSFELSMYLCGISYFLNGLEKKESEIRTNAIEYSFRILFGKISLFGGVICFMLFLISAVIFLSYDSEVQILREEYKDRQIVTDKVIRYQKEIDRLEKSMSVNNREILHAKFATELAEEVPSGINLTLLDIYPVNLKRANRNKPLVNQGELIIHGECPKLRDFSNWIEVIKDYQWVYDIARQEVKKDGRIFKFSLTLNVQYVE